MDFNYWKNEIADMPTKGENGWFDLETGISYADYCKPSAKAPKAEKPEAFKLNGKVATRPQMLAHAAKLAGNQQYDINKAASFPDSAAKADYLAAAHAAVEAIAALTATSKKAAIEAAINLNADASRSSNRFFNAK